MSDIETTTEVPAAPAPVTPKKGKAAKKPAAEKKSPKPKAEKKVPTHPPASVLVVEAVTKLNEKGGSSLQAIKKSIA
ncbi:unnamed protein product, partial [Allacma fusca]